MTLIARLQGLCLYVLLVCTGTLGAALCLLWIGARIAPLPDHSGPHPMEPVVIGLVMGLAGSGIAYVLLEFAARLLPASRAAAARLAAGLSRLSPRGRLAWGVAALACTGLIVDLL